MTPSLVATEPPPHREITVHFDGSCLGNPGPGGYAAILTNTLTGNRKIVKGHAKGETTNNQMELLAAIRALQAIQPGAFVTMVGDSEYVIKGITGRMQSWKAKGWRTSAGTLAKNIELWLELEEACLRPAKLEWRWQQGHAGCALNDEADRVAKSEADKSKSKMKPIM
ncbi:ribonuclease H [Bosea sp. 685]|uniref:ribonuclease H family protein n=1 Tax=Bosea sp. 685 TaxID=3080057 RepID=UPI002892AEE7|nr:ribonuclease H [Bosea sp. 685]WNJ91768.1 ribonuclease H [Bosea sp. 685]